MDPAAYRDLLDRVVAWARDEPRVVGLVAVGSTAGVARRPDPWSDHDLLVVTRDGAAAGLLADVSWLPGSERIVLARRSTEEARCVVYDDGHLVEVAVFDDSQLLHLDMDTQRVLLDGTGTLAGRLGAMDQRTRTALAAADPAGTERFHRFVVELVVGLSRSARGEHFSAHHRVRGQALADLLALVADFVPAERPARLDGLDPHRRFELAYPARARELGAALQAPLVGTAETMLDLAERDLVGRVPAATEAPLRAVRRLLARVVENAAAG